jgi:uncharacterized protein (TIGR02246 family)
MVVLRLTFLVFLISPNSFCQDNKTYKSKDQAALKDLERKWSRFWNTHDMDSMGTLLREDVDFVNVAGQWLKGKKETVAVHEERHLVVFKTSTWKTDSVSIKYVKDDLAIMHIGWGISGDVDPDGKAREPRHGVFTWVVIKQKNQWLLLAVHNVNIRETGAFSR